MLQTESVTEIQKLKSQYELLSPLVAKIKTCHSIQEKMEVLSDFALVKRWRASFPKKADFLDSLSLDLKYSLTSLVAIEQLDLIVQQNPFSQTSLEHFQNLVKELSPVDQFYADLGGIVGYHHTFLNLLLEKETLCHVKPQEYEAPKGWDISKPSPWLAPVLEEGILATPQMAEIFPVGGAADRLKLHDEKTHEPLPAAEMHFMGRTLLEGLFRDLEAREYLYTKLTGKKTVTPVVLMTSKEKHNDVHIKAMLERASWFGRPKDSFYFVTQPLVPMILRDGSWAVRAPFELIFKPGGHGMLWKLVEEQGAFRWLEERARSKAIIRQINNPVAGLDTTLHALAGKGVEPNHYFGFVSCERVVHGAEGMVVQIEAKNQKGFKYSVTNIEYTDFEKMGIQDVPSHPSSPYSQFPANTNILFVDLKKIRELAKNQAHPGLLVNLKESETCLDGKGQKRSLPMGRLESTMQNIADTLFNESPRKLTDEEKAALPTYVVFNKRYKTLAVTKKTKKAQQSLRDTPEESFYCLQKSAYELLRECGFTLPSFPEESKFDEEGPSFLFTYHPALGPHFSIIAQKLKSGKFHLHSELNLEIANAFIYQLDLQGSLFIEATHPVGADQETGKCQLKNVVVKNRGIIKEKSFSYWKQSPPRHEMMRVRIEGNGEFYAENVTFKGSFDLTVPKGVRLIAEQEGTHVKFREEKISSPTWAWEYAFDENHSIKLNLRLF